MKQSYIFLLFIAVALLTSVLGTRAQTYNQDDLTALKNFFMQKSADETKTNGEVLGVTDIDNWNPETETAKVQWNEETPKRLKFIQWEEIGLSGNLDITPCTAIESIELNNNDIISLLLPEESPSLSRVFVRNNNLKSLTLPKVAPALMSINCAMNKIELLEMPTNATSLFMIWANDNKLTYSTLPKLSTDVEMAYSPQDTIRFVESTGTVDLKKEYTIINGGNDNFTTFEWYIKENNELTLVESSLYTDDKGEFTFDVTIRTKELICKMQNPLYPELTLIASVTPAAVAYHDEEIESLKNFFRQMSKDGQRTNAQILEVADIENWDPETEAAGLTWNTENPKRLISIYWVMKGVAGELDLTDCKYVQRIELNRNDITKLNFATETPDLVSIFAPTCKLVTLTLPKKAPKLTTIDCYDNKLKELILPEEAGARIEIKAQVNNISKFTIPETLKNNIYLLWLHENELTEINIPDALPIIRYFYLRDNKLTNCELPDNIGALEHFWIERNGMKFSTLPQPNTTVMVNYTYAPQDTIIIENAGISHIDLSNEYNITKDGIEKTTAYEWFELSGMDEKKIEDDNYTQTNGIFSFENAFAGKTLRCKMTNEHFPVLTLVCDVTTSTTLIEHATHEPGFILYPNPANDMVNIKFNEVINNELNINIYDINGREVLRKSLKNNSVIEATIPLNGFKEGTYFVKIYSSDKEITRKLMIR